MSHQGARSRITISVGNLDFSELNNSRHYLMSPQQVKVIQMKAVRTPVIKKRENGTENLRHIKRRKRNININVGNHQKTLIVTVIQEKRRRKVEDKLLIIKETG